MERATSLKLFSNNQSRLSHELSLDEIQTSRVDLVTDVAMRCDFFPSLCLYCFLRGRGDEKDEKCNSHKSSNIIRYDCATRSTIKELRPHREVAEICLLMGDENMLMSCKVVTSK